MGKKTEPFEEVSIEVPENLSGSVMEKLGKRRGELKDMRSENGISYLEFVIPTRGLIGYRNEFMIDTKRAWNNQRVVSRISRVRRRNRIVSPRIHYLVRDR